jgi:hypothetical protein
MVQIVLAIASIFLLGVLIEDVREIVRDLKK